MKPIPPDVRESQFQSATRQSYRAGTTSKKAWDEWVNGPGGGSKSSASWVKIGGLVIAILVLGGIIAALVIELG